MARKKYGQNRNETEIDGRGKSVGKQKRVEITMEEKAMFLLTL
jgi:hypothetical protein